VSRRSLKLARLPRIGQDCGTIRGTGKPYRQAGWPARIWSLAQAADGVPL